MKVVVVGGGVGWVGHCFFAIASRKLAGVNGYFIGICLFFRYERIQGKKLSNNSLGRGWGYSGYFWLLQLVSNEKCISF